jgi:hypothetical protein
MRFTTLISGIFTATVGSRFMASSAVGRIEHDRPAPRHHPVSRITLPDVPLIEEFDGLPSSASRVL